jgi:hypothetical protein
MALSFSPWRLPFSWCLSKVRMQCVVSSCRVIGVLLEWEYMHGAVIVVLEAAVSWCHLKGMCII